MTTNKRDYYDVLGVARGASDDEIKRAFRRLAKQYHPDANKEDGAEARFIEINEAYETLSDHQKRDTYNRFGHAGLGGTGTGSAASSSAFDDLFTRFFAGADGGEPARTGTVRGADLRCSLSITFQEAVLGCQKEVELPRWETCAPCRGQGSQPGSPLTRCSTCQGTGEVRRVQQSIFGQFVNVTTCERCRGQGRVTTTPCEHCKGLGRLRVNQRVMVNIPGGVDDGMNVRVIGEGEAGPSGGPPGNLYVALTVTPHPFFQRHGNDLLYELPMSIVQAALGEEVEIPTVDGVSTRLVIPAGTQDGSLFRLKGMGVPIVHGTARGDQHVIVRVVTPTNLSAAQRRLIQELARLERARSGRGKNT